ncbi:MAG: sugar ABC transporter permease [Clostridia bacterium]|nr:sugar ABC transporter permease [Clostridia bacterium]
MSDIVTQAIEAAEEPSVSENAGVTVPEIQAAELDKNGFIKKSRKKASLDAKKANAGYLFVLPFLIGIILIYLPILVDSIWLSLSAKGKAPEGGDQTKMYYAFVGLENYISAITDDTGFVTSLVSGIQQLIFEVPAVIIFSLFIAVVLNQKMLGRAVFRAIFFLPVIVSTGIMESINAGDKFSSSSQSGINDGSGSGGASEIISVLDVQALFSGMKVGGEIVVYVVNIVNRVYDIINYSGVQMLIFLAGLQSISPSIYEACRIDGATGWETFWKVTFPMISPIILVNSFYTIIDALTRSQNPMIKFVTDLGNQYKASAMYWMYFLVILLIIAAVAGIGSTFVFYQRRD